MRSKDVRPRTLVLVGSVRGVLKDGRIGGQAFACRSLMGSRLATEYQIRTIDSSVSSISVNLGLLRAPAAAYRLAQFGWGLIARRPFAALLFASHGLSFLEKGVMALMATTFGVRVLLMPRSGHLVPQLDRNLAFSVFARFVLRHVTVTICQSITWQRYFLQLTGGRGHFRVVENWLQDDAFVAPEAETSTSGGSDFVVGYFNRIEESKGIFDFIEAIRLASHQIPNLRAVIYGDGSCLDQMRTRIIELHLQSVVVFKGWLWDSDKHQQLRSLDAYVFSSHVEGFPNSLLEVLALKVPVVSVRVGAVPDVIEDGVTGMLVDIKDVQGIAAKITRLAQNPDLRRRTAQAAYDRVLLQNTLERAVCSIEEALQ